MMDNRAVSDPEEAHYRRMRVLKILGLVLALCLACALGALFGGGLVFGAMKLGEASSSAKTPARVNVEKGLVEERIITPSGARIVQVEPGSPAEAAGLQEGDVIVSVDGQSLSSDQDLAGLVAGHEPGDWISLEVTRPDEGQFEVRVRLAENPDNQGAPFLGVRYAATPSVVPPGSRVFPYGGQGNPQQMPFPMPGADVEQGVIIVSVVEDSPASAAGLQEGDVITALDGEPIDGPDALVERVATYEPGDRVTLAVYRAGGEGEQEIAVTLGEHPDDPARAFLGVSIGAYMERRRFQGGALPEGFRFGVEPYSFSLPGDQAPFSWGELPFDPSQLPFDWEQPPFNWDDLPFDPRELPFEWHELEPDMAPGGTSA